MARDSECPAPAWQIPPPAFAATSQKLQNILHRNSLGIDHASTWQSSSFSRYAAGTALAWPPLSNAIAPKGNGRYEK